MEGMWRKAKRAMEIGICAHLPAVTGDRDDCASERRASDAFSRDSAALASAVAHASAPNKLAHAEAAERESLAAAPCESGEMVLAQLGGSLSHTLARMTNATVVNERVLSDCLNEITRALLQADIQFDMVRGMQASVKRVVYLGALAAGTDKRRVIKTICPQQPGPRPAHPHEHALT
ncbi:Signal recognition particle 54 kDa protein 2 [Hordeum vulgare]|nr:Signal recognition particle 54 kDa protein 2 [Hordeum vulgare]